MRTGCGDGWAIKHRPITVCGQSCSFCGGQSKKHRGKRFSEMHHDRIHWNHRYSSPILFPIYSHLKWQHCFRTYGSVSEHMVVACWAPWEPLWQWSQPHCWTVAWVSKEHMKRWKLHCMTRTDGGYEPAVDKHQNTAKQDHTVTLDDIRPGWFGVSPCYSHYPANSGKSPSSMEAKTHRWDLL